jgi:hypothetical protein
MNADFLARARALRLAAQPTAEVRVIPTMIAEIRAELDQIERLLAVASLDPFTVRCAPSIAEAEAQVDHLGRLVDAGKALREDFSVAVQRLSAAWLAEIRRVQKGTP